MTAQTTSTSSLVQPLFDGPLDIVGDVHGEIEPLRALMRQLGYSEDGHHPDGRRLIFVGDLTDRGPDSPAVVDLVQQLILAERAQCVLGNHDLNILLKREKRENKWFYGKEFFHDEKVVPQVLADEAIRERVLSVFRTLPIALERDDLRVVHACWDDKMIKIARESSNVVSLYHEHRKGIKASFPGLDLDEIGQNLEHQNKNPVKRLTSGPEERTEKSFRDDAGIKRDEDRVKWWNDYRGAYCVFGHYGLEDDGEPRGTSSTYCVDFGVGKRWTERRDGKTGQFKWKLAALRWPERMVVFDDGTPTTALPE